MLLDVKVRSCDQCQSRMTVKALLCLLLVLSVKWILSASTVVAPEFSVAASVAKSADVFEVANESSTETTNNETDIASSPHELEDAIVNQKDYEQQIAPFDEWTKLQLQKKEKEAAAAVPKSTAGSQSAGEISNGPIPGGANTKSNDGSNQQTQKDQPVLPSPTGGNSNGGAAVEKMASQNAPLSSDRNYASKECGAKVMLAHPEAEHASALVKEKERDEYMRSPCDAQMQYFVIELCETIQPEKIQIANYELFSSGVKDVRVSGSERYPTSEWTTIGEFSAEDSRGLQSFLPTVRGVYAKFLKVDLLSHYGNEHYCTLSLVRAFGKSMVDELEEHDRQMNSPSPAPTQPTQTTPTEDPADKLPTAAAPNLTTPVKASETGPGSVPAPGSEEVARNDGNLVFKVKAAVMNITKGVLSTASSLLGRPSHQDDVRATCGSSWPHFLATLAAHRCQFCSALLGPSPSRRRSSKFCKYFLWRRTKNTTIIEPSPAIHLLQRARHRLLDDPIPNTDMRARRVKKPKPYHRAKHALPPTNTSKLPLKTAKRKKGDARQRLLGQLREVFDSLRLEKQAKMQASAATAAMKQALPSNGDYKHPPGVPLPGPTVGQKESLFIRLNNRLKSLEQNISLSGQYLSELSRKYVSQMEEIQRQYNRTLRILNETQTRAEQARVNHKRETDALRQQIHLLNTSIIHLLSAKTDQEPTDHCPKPILALTPAEQTLAPTIGKDTKEPSEQPEGAIGDLKEGLEDKTKRLSEDADYFLLACLAVLETGLIGFLLLYICCCMGRFRRASIQRMIRTEMELNRTQPTAIGNASADHQSSQLQNADGCSSVMVADPASSSTLPRKRRRSSRHRQRRSSSSVENAAYQHLAAVGDVALLRCGGDSALGGCCSTSATPTPSEMSSEFDQNSVSRKASAEAILHCYSGDVGRLTDASAVSTFHRQRSSSFGHELTPVKEDNWTTKTKQKPPTNHRHAKHPQKERFKKLSLGATSYSNQGQSVNTRNRFGVLLPNETRPPKQTSRPKSGVF